MLLRGGPPPPLREGKGGGEDEKGRAALGGRKLGQCARIAQWPAGRLLQQVQQQCWRHTHQAHTRGWPAGSLTFPRWRSLGHRWEIKQLPVV